MLESLIGSSIDVAQVHGRVPQALRPRQALRRIRGFHSPCGAKLRLLLLQEVQASQIDDTRQEGRRALVR